MGWTFTIIVWLLCAGIGAAITSSKNRGAGEGLFLGGLLGIIGIVIAACLRRELPKAPPGMIAVQCPRCNAVQNVTIGQAKYQCWQCHVSNTAPGFEPEFEELAKLDKQRSETATARTRKVRCYNCKEVQVVPDGPRADCGHCGARMKLA